MEEVRRGDLDSDSPGISSLLTGIELEIARK
jgi:hypothetical protein